MYGFEFWLGGSVDVVAIEGGVCSLKYKVGG